jgi:hypothetical protein
MTHPDNDEHEIPILLKEHDPVNCHINLLQSPSSLEIEEAIINTSMNSFPEYHTNHLGRLLSMHSI